MCWIHSFNVDDDEENQLYQLNPLEPKLQDFNTSKTTFVLFFCWALEVKFLREIFHIRTMERIKLFHAQSEEKFQILGFSLFLVLWISVGGEPRWWFTKRRR